MIKPNTQPTETPTQPQKDTAAIEQPKPLIYGVTGANKDLTINTGKTIHYGEQMPKLHEPIIQYTSQQQLNESLKEWQTRLGLQDWSIVAQLVDVFPENIGANGHCSQNYVAKTAFIRILQIPLSESGIDYIKFCSEQTLVHELLHCVIYGSTIINENKCSISEQYMDTRIHAELESLAMAFIMAKYNITIDWFKV